MKRLLGCLSLARHALGMLWGLSAMHVAAGIAGCCKAKVAKGKTTKDGKGKAEKGLHGSGSAAL